MAWRGNFCLRRQNYLSTMKFTFRAKIYKVGINPCVEVPGRITRRMIPQRGYIPVTGHIDKFPFEQTLVPVKDAPYRLYVNGLMLNGSGAKVGDTLSFRIEQTSAKRKDETMPADLRSKLVKAKLLSAFEQLTPSRQKEILRYLNYLKTAQAKKRNIDKVLSFLKSDV
jgi:hypothetical protein